VVQNTQRYKKVNRLPWNAFEQ